MGRFRQGSPASPAGVSLVSVTSRWSRSDAPRGDAYAAQWEALAAAGAEIHGEAAFVETYRPSSVLDAGCGTGRVAIELARRGIAVAGVDLDPAMLATARRDAPELDWIESDLAALDLRDDARNVRTFDLVVAAGNVMIFVDPGTEHRVLERLAAHLRSGGRLVAGFQCRTGGYDVDTYDADAAAAGLALEERFATWDRDPWVPGADYAVSVHRRPSI